MYTLYNVYINRHKHIYINGIYIKIDYHAPTT